MGLFQAFDITASGMEAQRFRMDTIAENIANVNTTRKENSNEPYRRKVVTFETRSLNPMFEDSLDDYLTKFQGNGVRPTLPWSMTLPIRTRTKTAMSVIPMSIPSPR